MVETLSDIEFVLNGSNISVGFEMELKMMAPYCSSLVVHIDFLVELLFYLCGNT